jgi:hypothetical protein
MIWQDEGENSYSEERSQPIRVKADIGKVIR